ncbi:spermidine/putrescine ABC transporter substrate-binding protein, partial [Burkholderia cenocepacia]|nr:spermidine/putrescine ABC transporter substrate-binding protein [Burkholderia cenocepacia]
MQPGDSRGVRLIRGIGAGTRARRAVRTLLVILTVGLPAPVPPAVAASPETVNDNVLRVLAWPG